MTHRRHPREPHVPDVLVAHLASVGSMTLRSEPSGRRRLERVVGRELAETLVGTLAGRNRPRAV